MSGEALVPVILGISVLAVATFIAVDGLSEEPEPDTYGQIISLGENYETWALQNPYEAGEVMDGESYGKITKAVLGEEPHEKLNNHKIFFLKQDDEQYGLCVSKSFENTPNPNPQSSAVVKQEAFIYSTVTKKVAVDNNCMLDVDENEPNDVNEFN